jgi:hypothetical protein
LRKRWREKKRNSKVCVPNPICPAHNKYAKDAKEFTLPSEPGKASCALPMIRVAFVRASR